jgi:hypothetical protein
VRSTLLVASYKMVREMGREADYVAALEPGRHATVLELVAGTWADLDLALAHYRACETLGLSDAAQIDIGRTVGRNIRETVAGTLFRATREMGFTPWTMLEAVPRFWHRMFDGSTVSCWRTGPKDALLEARGLPLLDVRYFRNALRGQIMGGADLFCTRSFTSPRGTSHAPGSWALRLQWA